MSVLLSLDASSQHCSVSLMVDESVTHLAELQPRRHAQRLLPMVDEILTSAGISKQQLDGVAYGRGPGSFTGIRIAASLVQGISLGLNLPVFGFSSLQLVAIRAALQTGISRVVAVMDAHMGEVFWGCFEADNTGLIRLVGKEQVGSPEVCLQQVADFGAEAETLIAGSGVALVDTSAVAGFEQSLEDCPPLTEHSVELVREAWCNRAFTGFEQHSPVYLRDSVAWKKLDQQPSLLKR